MLVFCQDYIPVRARDFFATSGPALGLALTQSPTQYILRAFPRGNAHRSVKLTSHLRINACSGCKDYTFVRLCPPH
jgi:hypothetical protein